MILTGSWPVFPGVDDMPDWFMLYAMVIVPMALGFAIGMFLVVYRSVRNMLRWIVRKMFGKNGPKRTEPHF